jgi:hypothetical protein
MSDSNISVLDQNRLLGWTSEGEWTDPANGSVWTMDEYNPVGDYLAHKNRVVIASDAQGTFEAGKIRAKRVPKLLTHPQYKGICSKRGVWVYHKADALAFEDYLRVLAKAWSADGEEWTDPSDETKWTMARNSAVSSYLLEKNRIEVTPETQGAAVPRKIRVKRVPKIQKHPQDETKKFKLDVWVYHKEDAILFSQCVVEGWASEGEWTDPDGSEWTTDDYSAVSPRYLKKNRVEVKPDTQGIPVPGKIRAKRVPKVQVSAHNGATFIQAVWVYHKADAEAAAEKIAMPDHLNLKGKTYGDGTVIEFDEEKSREKKRHWWRVKYTCCRPHTTKSVSARNLLGGKSTSCGKCAHRFESLEVKREHARKARVFDNGRWWLAPRVAMKRLDISDETLSIWARSCSWLPDKRGIENALLSGGYGRKCTYYAEDDVRIVQEKMDMMPVIPRYPGLVHFADVLREMKCSLSTLRRRMEKVGVKFKKADAKGLDNRLIKLLYVPLEFVRQHCPDFVQPPLEITEQSEAEPATQEHEGTSTESPPVADSAEKRRGGRPRSSKVDEVRAYIYQRWIKGDKLQAIRRGAERTFPGRGPKEDSHVTREAKRYAEKHGLPTDRNSESAA